TLATRPMLALPEQASAPQPLAQQTAPAQLRLPAATGDIAGVPAGFPNTPEGAVGALAALTAQGLRGADPQTYIRAYQALSAPGARRPARPGRVAGQPGLRQRRLPGAAAVITHISLAHITPAPATRAVPGNLIGDGIGGLLSSSLDEAMKAVWEAATWVLDTAF